MKNIDERNPCRWAGSIDECGSCGVCRGAWSERDQMEKPTVIEQTPNPVADIIQLLEEALQSRHLSDYAASRINLALDKAYGLDQIGKLLRRLRAAQGTTT